MRFPPLSGIRVRNSLRAALLATVAALPVTAGPAVAQPVHAATRSFDIPAQPLGTALQRFMQQSGIQLSYPASLADERTSSPVSGDLSPAQALGVLLGGTGLTYRFVSPTAITLESAPRSGDGTVQLGPVRVAGESGGGSGDPAATEVTGRYTAAGPTGAATGLALTARETPQSLSVVTKQETLDRNDRTLQEALRYAPGINAVLNTGDTRWWYYSRGFQIENFQYDGVSTFSHYLSGRINSQPDMAMFDRIEVVRGATGLMTGAGDPSGSVNLLRKRATAEPRVWAEASAYSIGKGSLTADASGALNDSGTVRGRIVATGMTGAASERRHNARTYGLIFGTLDFATTENTTLSIGGSYAIDNTDGYDWGGLPTQPDGSFYPFYTSKTTAALPWEYADVRQAVAYLDIEHRFDSGWQVKATGRVSIGDSDVLSSRLMRAGANGGLDRMGTLDDQDGNSYAGNLSASGPVTLFGRQHDISFGFNASHDYSAYWSGISYYWAVPDPRHLDQPGVRDTYEAGPYWSRMQQTQYGAYVSGRFQLADPVHLILGGRLAWYENESAAGWGNSGFKARAEPVPYAGLVYDVSENVALYASYTRVFKPQNFISPSGGTLAPVQGSSVEAGVKAALLDEKLQINLALYQSDQTGLPVVANEPCRPGVLTCYDPAEKIRTRGIDIEVVGALTDRWNITASYTYADPEYVRGPKASQNYNTDRMPRSLGKLYTSYAFGGALDGLSAGGGVRVQSGIRQAGTERYSRIPFLIRQPGYAVFDLMLRYDLTETTQLQINVDNILDRHYYQAIGDSSYSNSIAAGRTASMTLRHAF